MRRVPVVLVILLMAAGSVVAQETSDGTVSLAWNPVAVTDGTTYRVHYGTSPLWVEPHTDQTDALTGTEVTITGLVDCTQWYFAARATTDGISGGYSSELAGFPRPRIHGVFPTSTVHGRTLEVMVRGVNFAPGVTVEFDAEGFTVAESRYRSCHEIAYDVQIDADVALGPVSVFVINQDRSAGEGSFEIVADPPAAPGSVPTAQRTDRKDGS